MPDIFAQTLQTPGLGILAITYVIAGLVRGLTGFGTALIFMPIGARAKRRFACWPTW